jgi:hypothetical protein
MGVRSRRRRANACSWARAAALVARRVLNPAVVGAENDERVVGELPPIQLVEQCAHRFVEPFAHRVIFGKTFVAAGSLILRQQPGRRIVRLVRQHRGVPEEERLAAAFVVRRGVLVEKLGDRLHRAAADGQPFSSWPRGWSSRGEAALVMPFHRAVCRLRAGEASTEAKPAQLHQRHLRGPRRQQSLR